MLGTRRRTDRVLVDAWIVWSSSDWAASTTKHCNNGMWRTSRRGYLASQRSLWRTEALREYTWHRSRTLHCHAMQSGEYLLPGRWPSRLIVPALKRSVLIDFRTCVSISVDRRRYPSCGYGAACRMPTSCPLSASGSLLARLRDARRSSRLGVGMALRTITSSSRLWADSPTVPKRCLSYVVIE